MRGMRMLMSCVKVAGAVAALVVLPARPVAAQEMTAVEASGAVSAPAVRRH